VTVSGDVHEDTRVLHTQLDASVPAGGADDELIVVGLVDRAARVRDPDAFGELYDRYMVQIYRYLYSRTGSRPDAEDLTEQVFLQAWEAIGRFRWQGRPFIAWLYRLAHNLLVDHWRKHRATEPLNELFPIADERATSEVSRRMDAQILADAIKELTPDQQQVIVMRFVLGHDGTEIAQILGKQDGTIRALQFRALAQLRRVLARQGITEM
jgi:RNA polymerase sigma-70 factor (ECF subfamily)